MTDTTKLIDAYRVCEKAIRHVRQYSGKGYILSLFIWLVMTYIS